MTLLADFAMAISTGRIGVVDLTAPLSANTPVLVLPEPFGQTDQFELREISHYDDRGPAWYWNNITTGEHTGTHLDAPIHWITGRELSDVSQIAPSQLIAPAAVIDVAEQVADRPGLPAGGRAHQGVGRRARPAAGKRLAAPANRMGFAQPPPGRVSQRGRDRTTHAGGQRRMRPLAGRGSSRHRGRRRDGRHGRRGGSFVRSGLPVPHVPARSRQVRPDPVAEPGVAAADGCRRDRSTAARSWAARAARPGCWR